jgi:O-antigen/teichoic acid export membrane protein
MRGPDSPGRNAAFTLATKVTGAAFTAVLTVVLVRKLGPDDYGVYALVTALGLILVLAGDFGISVSAARFIAERRADPVQVGAVLDDAVRLKLAISSVVSVLLFALAAPIADAFGIPAMTWPLRVTAIALFGQSIMTLWMAVFESLGRVALTLRLAFGESLLETTSSIALVLLGAGATGAVAGRAAGYAFAALLGLVVVVRHVEWRPLRSEEPGVHRSRIARYGAAMLVIEGAYVLFDRLDVLLIGAIVNAGAAGTFSAPLRLLLLLQYAGGALAGGMTPGLARGTRDQAAVERFVKSIRLLLLFQAASIAPVVVWAHPIVDLVLGGSYAQSVGILRALAPFAFLAGLAPLLTIAVNYMGEARRRVPIAIAALLINLIIDVLLIPEIGAIAGAIGSGVAFAVSGSSSGCSTSSLLRCCSPSRVPFSQRQGWRRCSWWPEPTTSPPSSGSPAGSAGRWRTSGSSSSRGSSAPPSCGASPARSGRALAWGRPRGAG